MTMYDQPNDLYAAILAKLSALEARVDALEAQEEIAFSDACMDGIVAALDEDDPDGWLGGTD